VTPSGRLDAVLELWPHDLEALESVRQNADALELFLRMAHLNGRGELESFLFELGRSDELDPETKAAFAEVAQDTSFLTALDDYVHCTRHLH
jgi:hypothetical protein